MNKEIKMLKRISLQTLVAALVFQLAAFPAVARATDPVIARADGPAAPAKPAPAPHSLIRMIRAAVEKNPAFFYEENEITDAKAEENRAFAMIGMDEILSQIKDSSYSLESIKDLVVRRTLEEEEAHLAEFRYLIAKFPSDELDVVFEAARERGAVSEEAAEDYLIAYTVKEKRAVLHRVVAGELALIKSQTVKRLGLMDRDALLRELELSRSLMDVKDSDTWKIVLVVVLAVAAAGFISWGIVAATKKHWERRTEQMNGDFDDDMEDLKEEYANREAELEALFRERARLRDEGYVWAVCKTEERVKTVSCSYDFKSHSGAEVCVTRCLRHPATGHETMHAVSCTSAYIPNNCFNANPYASGYDSGYDDGHSDGYWSGYDDAYHDAYSDHYYAGYNAGFGHGYDAGYNAGFSDGLSEAQYDDTYYDDSRSEKSDEVSQVAAGFKKGYREGYAYASRLLVGN